MITGIHPLQKKLGIAFNTADSVRVGATFPRLGDFLVQSGAKSLFGSSNAEH